MKVFYREKVASLLESQKKFRNSSAKERGGAFKRLEKAEKLAEQFVTSKLRQVRLQTRGLVATKCILGQRNSS